MDYSPWSSKNLIDRNQLKKFLQVGVDVTYMHTNFGGHDLSSLEILLLSKMAKFPFRPMDYSPWSSKNHQLCALLRYPLSLSLSLSVCLYTYICYSADTVYVLVFLMIATNLHSTQVSKSLDTLVNCCMQCALRYIIVYL